MNSFLAAGGDGFTVLTGGTNVLGGQVDVDAFEEYVKRNPALAPPALGHIVHGSNLPPTAGAFIVTTPTTTLAPTTTAAPTTIAAATTTAATTTTAPTTTSAAVTTTAATTIVPASATIAPPLEAEPAAESDAEVSFTG